VIGVLTDPTGIGAAFSGPPLIEAVRMAIRDTGPLPDGREVSLLTESFRLKPDDAVAIVTSWFDQGVSVVVDIPGTAAALAVQAAARSHRRSDLVTGSVTAKLTGPDCSPFGTTWTVDTTAMATALVTAVARTGINTGSSWCRIPCWARLSTTMQCVRSNSPAAGSLADPATRWTKPISPRSSPSPRLRAHRQSACAT
jgi:hypothetical protein